MCPFDPGRFSLAGDPLENKAKPMYCLRDVGFPE
jgi:hypothetical protein